jgi:hypothetical protein
MSNGSDFVARISFESLSSVAPLRPREVRV